MKKPLRLLALLLCSLAPLLHAQTGLTRQGDLRVETTTSGEPSLATTHHSLYPKFDS